MDIVNNTLEDAPKIGFSVQIHSKTIENFKENLSNRVKFLLAQFNSAKKAVERTNTKLAQHIAAFPNVGIDESRIYVVSEKKNSFACFSGCSNGKTRKNCQLF